MAVKDLVPGPRRAAEVFTRRHGEKGREGVMEFLARQPSLDCPISIKGGECRSAGLGAGLWRRLLALHREKRAVENKYIGPVVKTR